MSRIHPITYVIIGAVVLVAAGIYFIERQRPTVPNNTSGSWMGDSGYLNPVAVDTRIETPKEEPFMDPNVKSPDTLVIPKPASTSPAVKAMPQTAKDSFQSLLSEIAKSADSSSLKSVTSLSSLEQAFSHIPKITITSQAKVKTSEQQALFEYGNTVGQSIKMFGMAHTNMMEIVGGQVTDRTNPQKNSALKRLGNEYAALGKELQAVTNAPDSIKTAHDQLGASYVKLGELLAAIPDATEDQAFIAALTAYNNAADANTSALVMLATLFSLKDVTFTQADAGSVFSFQGN